MVHVEREKASDFEAITNELYGLWNLWKAHPDERERIEAFLLGILKDSAIKPVTRANLIADFAEIHRRDLIVERGQERISFPVTFKEILGIPVCGKK